MSGGHTKAATVPTPSAEALELANDLAASLDGTCLHEWSFALAAASGGLIATHPSGRRVSLSIEGWPIRPGGERG